MSKYLVASILEVFVSGISGCALGVVYGALFPIFVLLNPTPAFWLFLGLVFLLDTLFGLAEIFVGGFFFAIGLFIAGAFLQDLSTILLSLAGLFGLFFGIYFKERR